TPRSRDLPACARSRARRFDAQRFESRFDRFLRAVERVRIVAELAGEVCAEEKRVELECELRWIDASVEMSFVLRHLHRSFERVDPFIHRGADDIAHRA